MSKKPKPPARPKFHCHYTTRNQETVQFLRDIEGEFICPSCSSVLKQGKVYFCNFCKTELGVCCHTKFTDKHKHQDEIFNTYRDLPDYIPPVSCQYQGVVRCRCCERLLCLGHARGADLSRASVLGYDGEKLTAAVLCPDCKSLLDPDPEPDRDYVNEPEPGSFERESDLRAFLRRLGQYLD